MKRIVIPLSFLAMSLSALAGTCIDNFHVDDVVLDGYGIQGTVEDVSHPSEQPTVRWESEKVSRTLPQRLFLQSEEAQKPMCLSSHEQIVCVGNNVKINRIDVEGLVIGANPCTHKALVHYMWRIPFTKNYSHRYKTLNLRDLAVLRQYNN